MISNTLIALISILLLLLMSSFIILGFLFKRITRKNTFFIVFTLSLTSGIVSTIIYLILNSLNVNKYLLSTLPTPISVALITYLYLKNIK